MCDLDGSDPFTMAGRLCDDDRMVRRGAMHHGTDYLCTGHAHFQGHHIRCTNPAHVQRPNPAPGPWYPAALAHPTALTPLVQHVVSTAVWARG
jgi:hypothetical protein